MHFLRRIGLRPKLPAGLGSAKELMARFDDAKQRKNHAEPALRDAYMYALPQREAFNENYTELQKKNLHIFDSTAIRSAPGTATR